MALALRIRVTWADDVIEDVVHEGERAIRIGAGANANVVAPGRPDRLVRFIRGRNGYQMEIPSGAVESIEFPGEEPIGGERLGHRLARFVGVGCGRLKIGGAEVDFEVLRTERDHAWLHVSAGLAGVAMLALFAGFGYHIVRQRGDGPTPKWGEAMALGADRAKLLRVTMDPVAEGASKLVAGEGLALHGVAESPLLHRSDATKSALEKPAKKASATSQARAKTRVDKRARIIAAHRVSKLAADEGRDSGEEDESEIGEKSDDATLLETGQQALLAAELRDAIDALTAAEKTDALDYDNLNWLGLAHYFLGENALAEARWRAAVELDPTRPDALNNLGGIARRHGDTAGEIAAYQKALSFKPGDCHALNSMALALAKQGRFEEATKTLAEGDAACGGDYAYTFIQRAGILSLEGRATEAMAELEKGLARVDTLLPIKEYEVEADLLLDPAFASLRKAPAFDALTSKWLPRAVGAKAEILSSVGAQPERDQSRAPINAAPRGASAIN